MTKQTKETIKTSAVIVIVLLGVFFLWIYPLNQAGKIIERPEESSSLIDLSEHGLIGEDFKILTEDNLSMSGFYIQANLDSAAAQPAGTVVLLHGLFSDMSSQIDKAKVLADLGYNCAIYDQRGFGQSDGEFRSGGYYEANDLHTLLTRMELEDRLVHPIVLWGEDHGGTAAIRTANELSNVDFCIAENPVVDGIDWEKRVIKARDMSAPDFYLSFIWWWMKQTSSYEISLDESDVSDAFGMVTEKKPNGLLIIAAGAGNTPINEKLAELQGLGGNWLVVPAGDNLFTENQEVVMDRFVTMMKPSETPVE
ncbi:MAG: alpha/beta fold hydrolase [Candidatus Zixiibacteriota bacterium]